MVERQIELRRRRARRDKLTKLKDRLAKAKNGGERDTVLKRSIASARGGSNPCRPSNFCMKPQARRRAQRVCGLSLLRARHLQIKDQPARRAHQNSIRPRNRQTTRAVADRAEVDAPAFLAGGKLPAAHAQIVARRKNRAGIRELHRSDPVGVPRNAARQFALGPVPDFQRLVLAAADERLAVGRKRQAGDRFLVLVQRDGFAVRINLAVLQGPKANRRIIAGGGEPGVVGGDCDGVDPLGVARERGDVLSGRQVPPFDGAIAAAGKGELAVAAQRDRRDRGRVPFERLQEFAGLDVPDLDRLVGVAVKSCVSLASRAMARIGSVWAASVRMISSFSQTWTRPSCPAEKKRPLLAAVMALTGVL